MGSGNKRRFLACKECHSVSHIDGLTEAFQGIAGNQTGNLRLIIAGSGHILDKCGCFRAGGADHVDADTEGSQLQSQALCKLNDPTLGGIVCEALHAANHAQFTAGADNGAVAALFHKRQGIFCTQEIPLQVDSHYAIPVFFSGIPKRFAQRVGGIVVQHIDHAILFLYCLKHRLHLRGIADICFVEPSAFSKLSF